MRKRDVLSGIKKRYPKMFELIRKQGYHCYVDGMATFHVELTEGYRLYLITDGFKLVRI